MHILQPRLLTSSGGESEDVEGPPCDTLSACSPLGWLDARLVPCDTGVFAQSGEFVSSHEKWLKWKAFVKTKEIVWSQSGRGNYLIPQFAINDV